MGGGVAGLSAAWWLRRAGACGRARRRTGTRCGRQRCEAAATTCPPIPGGAHYVPLLTADSVHAAALFTDLGIITGRDAAGLPIYDPFALCTDPRERAVSATGAWQEDLLPDEGGL